MCRTAETPQELCSEEAHRLPRGKIALGVEINNYVKLTTKRLWKTAYTLCYMVMMLLKTEEDLNGLQRYVINA